MGKKQSKNQVINFLKINLFQLPDSLKEKVLKLFSLIDTDGSKTIDKQETLKFWSSSFAKLNTQELFDSVDKNNDGAIQEEEWLEFWTTVYLSGYKEEEISSELDNLLNKGSWVKFDTPPVKRDFNKKKSLKSQGKI